ncbi:uncharacterized protein LOC105426404 [Pogonomyrmex barbatus]|uniref:Odorant receptor n=1 Tax=Pogonomyrmex barbatus TaxID=144034 RepID=A0A6I9W3M4_9HYME|nr:uncharacterized protein LOC105426404 [Pogonomyrmex barbatus]
MTDKRLQAYHKYQRFLRGLLITCGCWYAPTKSGKSTYYWSVCILLSLFAFSSLSLRISYMYRHHLSYMMKNIGIMLTTLGSFFKVSCFLINRRSLINYHRTLSSLFEEELTQNEKVRTVMLSPLRTISTLAYTYSGCTITLSMTYLMPTFIVIIRGIFHLHLPTNYSLPYSRGYGYLWTVPTGFLRHFHLLFEICIIMMQCITTTGVDSVFGFYIYLLSSTMRAMTFRLTNPLPNDKFSDVLRVCVAKHLKLIQCRDTLKRVYSLIILWHIVTNAVLLCALIFEAMQDEDFRKGVYFSEWPNSSLNHHVRTNILLIMMQKPMTIKVFSASVDVVMFTNFVNTTMSYFFLLQSLGDKGG